MSKFGISQSVKRVEDGRLLKGEGRYVDDFAWEGQARAVFLRSPVAHGTLTKLDVSDAKAAPGVLAVVTAADLDMLGGNHLDSFSIPNRDGSQSANPTRVVFARDRVRFVGDALAMVVAESLAEARDAVEMIDFRIDDLDVVTELEAALTSGAAQIHEEAPSNLCLDWAVGDEAAVDAALAAADAVVTLDLINNKVISNPMETRGVLAKWDGQKMTMETNTQGVWCVKNELADRLKLDPEQVLVTTADVGGGFGTKSYPYPEQIAVGYAAKVLSRPVKWMAERSEGFVSDAMGRDHFTVAKAGFDANRKMVALKVETLAGMGAYLSMNAPYIPTDCAVKVLPGVYDLQAAFYGVKGVFTNTVPVDAYRGAGRPESIYMLERLMDKAAREFGEDPVALRRKSYIPADAMTYRTAVGE
ncbi:MAG: molybdopterin-dependent oxidoreductase, partial [Rhodobacteraceae bacterium]|nr:molybdopterin-dependent oxidoreductase [Paracoccaceae bacterium]